MFYFYINPIGTTPYWLGPHFYAFLIAMIDKEIKQQILSKFRCQKTGNCCRRDGIVYASQDEIKEMAASLDIDIATFMSRFTKRDNGWTVISTQRFRPNCFLDDNNGCSIYNARPKHCRTYPDWPQIWDNKESLLTEASLCPALKKACLNLIKDLK